MKTVVFFANTNILPGLHVTLLTLLKSLYPVSVSEIVIIVFADKISEKEKDKIKITHSLNPNGTKLEIRDYTPKSLAGANSLHGNVTTYGRLYLSQLLPDVEKCVYLDSDLLINTSVLEIFDRFDGANVLLVDGTGKREYSLDTELFRKADLPMDGACFNPGVMGIDLELWRKEGIERKCRDVAVQYRGMFRSADQALLNVALHDSFLAIGNKFNTPLLPNGEVVTKKENIIYHFVGSPKPWDIFGRSLHSNYKIWKDVYQRTALSGVSTWKYASLKHSLRISRAAFKAWRTKRRKNP